MSPKSKKILLLLGDIALFYGSLWIVLSLRYPDSVSESFSLHLIPFSFLLPVWLLIFFIANLYDPKTLKNGWAFISTLISSIFINTLLSIAFLYLTPFFGITPRANLAFFLATFFILSIIWRQAFNTLISWQTRNSVLLIGDGTINDKIESYLKDNPQLGYHLVRRLNQADLKNNIDEIESLITNRQINTIVLPQNLKSEFSFVKSLYKKLNLSLEILSSDAFFERIFERIPLSEIKDIWFLDNLTRRNRTYELSKRFLEIILSLFLLVILSPLLLILALLVRLTSRGPAIYKQKRIGQNECPFTLYKFRSMVKDAETAGATWATHRDPRLTLFGSFIRHAHLDELPQLWNILRGDLSFVGPRPERPEFTKDLERVVPFYELRHIVRPGLTGWAQINFRYGSSSEDAYEKLQYDLYYIKNRSLVFDSSIILRTIKTFFITPR